MATKISKITIYPVKSLGAVTLTESAVGRRGLELDRRFMLVDPNGMHLTQRDNPKFACVRIAITDNEILLDFDKKEGLKIPLTELDSCFNDARKVQVWKSSVDALIAVESINRWFRDLFGTDMSLAYMPGDSERRISESFIKGNDIVSFADAYPLLLANSASLRELNSRLEEPVPMSRFRPNVVVEGKDAFEEDKWKRVRIGNVDFRVTKPCSRCVVTTIDQGSGEKHKYEPLRTLAGFRKASDVFPKSYQGLDLDGNDVLFGTTLVPETEGASISVGDELIVID